MTDEFTRQALAEWQAGRSARRRGVWMHAIIYVVVNLLLVVIWAVTGAGFPWFVFPLFGWLIGLVIDAASAYVLRTPDDELFARELRRSRGR